MLCASTGQPSRTVSRQFCIISETHVAFNHARSSHCHSYSHRPRSEIHIGGRDRDRDRDGDGDGGGAEARAKRIVKPSGHIDKLTN